MEVLLPLSSPHRRLQLMIRAPEVSTPDHRACVVILFCFDTGSLQHDAILCLFNVNY